MGCLPNKQGGFSCIAAPLLSKIQSLLPTPKKAGQSAVAGTGPTRPHPPVRTGDITTGQKAEAASQSISTSGGTIAINKSGDPLDGFVIDVPAKSYPDSHTFKVSSAPITKQTFGSDITPVSPMISVDNGGGYSDEIMYIRVPVKVPEDSFAMGFIYDEKTKQLEGMELVGSDAESVTVATRHFSNFFVSMIKKALLKNDIDSGFQPGIDDWQLPNYGSYIAPGGQCEGQSLTALWYYCTRPDGPQAHLYNRYDNNGNQPATPALWQDDSLGYRFCSVIQEETRFGADIAVGDARLSNFWNNLGGHSWDKVQRKWISGPNGIGDEAAYNLFSYTIRATGEPQEVVMRSNAGGGHAMIVYKVVGNALYVADPNYHGNTDRRINYCSDNSTFTPYNSGANRKEIDAGHGKAYERIIYSAKSAIVPWDKIAQRWSELKNKTIGNDKFPAYELQYEDDKGDWQELKDGYVSPTKMIAIEPAPGICDIFRDGSNLPMDALAIELKPGNNLLGIYVQALDDNGNYRYNDFKYINVVFKSTSPKQKSTGHPVIEGIQGPTHIVWNGPPYEYKLEISGGTPPYNVEWRGNNIIFSGAGYETVKIKPDQLRDNNVGYWVFINVKDAAGKYAQWVNEDGVSKQEFTYGVTNTGVIMTEPAKFPYKQPGQ